MALIHFDSTSPQRPERANDNFEVLYHSAAYGFDDKATRTSGDLKWFYFGGLVQLIDGAYLVATEGFLTLADDDDSYVEVNPATGALSSNTVGFSAGSLPVAIVTTAAGLITASRDVRQIKHLETQARGAQTIPFADPLVIISTGAKIVIVEELTADTTIDPPLGAAVGHELWVALRQNAIGGWTPTLDAIFKMTALGSGTANQALAFRVLFDGTDWIQVGSDPVWR